MRTDLLIIGGGPGGYEIAAEAAASGKKVTLVERDQLGGTCLNRGCIPTKCLCASASAMLAVKSAAEFGVNIAGEVTAAYSVATTRMEQVITRLREGIDMLLKPVEVVRGEARLAAGGKVIVGDECYEADRVLIATGSKPALLPIPGAELALTSDDFLKLTSLPERVCIIGGGVIGMEFASILAAFGVEVSVVEFCKEILPPFDPEVAKRLRTSLSRRGVKTIVGAAVTSIAGEDGEYTVTYAGKKGDESILCDAVIMAVGRKPVVPEGCEEAGVKLTPRGFIEVADDMSTSAPGIYAVGDVNGRCMLAHAAAAQAKVALGEKVNLDIIPSAVFTIPECAMAGLTETQCQANGMDCASAKSMFAANGKALSMGEGDGFVKVLFDKADGRLLGVHIIGPHAADIVAEASAFLAEGRSVKDVGEVIHGHPTLSEAFSAACAMAASKL